MSIKDYLGNIKTLLVDIPNADLKAEIQSALIDAQGEALDLQERVALLQEENSKLADQLREKSRTTDLDEKLYYARNAYWRRDEEIVSAYCPTCWDANRLLMRLDDYGRNLGYCHHCKNTFEGVYNVGRPAEG